MSQIKDRNKEN